MAELGHRMPDIMLVPFPVVTDKAKSEPWWSSIPTARLLFSEYLKYIVTQVRSRFEPSTPSTNLADRPIDPKG
jgi:hypothetical protein